MPPAKTLEQLIRSSGFRARRHEALLAGRLVAWPTLRAIQEQYLTARSPAEARAVAVEFERAARGHAAPAGKLTFAQHYFASCGPGQAQEGWFLRDDGTIDFRAFDELGEQWDEWNRKHGLHWRVRHWPDQLGNIDVLALGASMGEETIDLRQLEPRLAQLIERYVATAERVETPPDPPGWSRFAYGTRASNY